jgi:hypothetical protein
MSDEQMRTFIIECGYSVFNLYRFYYAQFHEHYLFANSGFGEDIFQFIVFELLSQAF